MQTKGRALPQREELDMGLIGIDCYAIVCPKCGRVHLFVRDANLQRVFCEQCETKIETTGKGYEENVHPVHVPHDW